MFRRRLGSLDNLLEGKPADRLLLRITQVTEVSFNVIQVLGGGINSWTGIDAGVIDLGIYGNPYPTSARSIRKSLHWNRQFAGVAV